MYINVILIIFLFISLNVFIYKLCIFIMIIKCNLLFTNRLEKYLILCLIIMIITNIVINILLIIDKPII